MAHHKWFTRVEEDRIIALYNTGLTIYQVAEAIQRTDGGVYGVLKRRGIKMKKYVFPPGSTVDEGYFDKIDTRQKAYFLGWLYSDGCNEPGRRRIRISLMSSDIGVLEKLKRYIKHTGNIGTYQRRSHSFNKNGKYSTLAIHNQRLSDALTKLGCVANKTYVLEFPTTEQVPTKFLRDFARGYVEGDGTLNCYKEHRFHFSLPGRKEFIQGFAKMLEQEVGITCVARPVKKSDWFYQINETGPIKAMKVLNWLYADCEDMFLERKLKNYYKMQRLFAARTPKNPAFRRHNPKTGRWVTDRETPAEAAA